MFFEFSFNGWALAWIIIFALWFLISSLTYWTNSSGHGYINLNGKYFGYWGFLFMRASIALGIVFVLFNVISFWVTATSDEDGDVSAISLAKHFGVEQGEAYPLTLGDGFSGTGGNIDVTSMHGLVSGGTSVHVNLQPQSMLSIDFEYQDRMAKLDMARTNISFIEDNDGSPSVKLYFLFDRVDRSQAYYDITYGECRWGLENLLATCHRDVESAELIVSDEAQRKGLGPIVSEFFESAELRLPTEQYQSTK